MTGNDIAQRRLHTQHIAGSSLETPEDVVRWLFAVQAQDYPAALWALGLRTRAGREVDINAAFDAGKIVRTHLLRPTWHFVTPDDIRLLLELTAQRVHALNATYYRKFELDPATLLRSNDLITGALAGGNQLTRNELANVLGQAGIASDGGLRLSYIMMHAELDGLICSGARRGKQHTYALLDERAPAARRLAREEALAELAGRFFVAHGPATVKDFAWWSGLTNAEARAGLEMVKAQLLSEVVADHSYWFAPTAPFMPDPSPSAYLLPNYDEYAIGYVVRDNLPGMAEQARQEGQPDIYFGHMLVIDGRIAGAWKRTLRRSAVEVSAQTFVPLTAAQSAAYQQAARRYGEFLGLPVDVS